MLPEIHKDHNRVLSFNGRSLILVSIPDGLSISGGQFDVNEPYREVPFSRVMLEVVGNTEIKKPPLGKPKPLVSVDRRQSGTYAVTSVKLSCNR